MKHKARTKGDFLRAFLLKDKINKPRIVLTKSSTSFDLLDIIPLKLLTQECNMPRVSQKEAEQTRIKIVNAAFDLLLESGENVLTFTNIAKKAGIIRSGINAHFKKKQDLLNVLAPMVSKIILDHLDMSSPTAFYSSWTEAIKTSQVFRNVTKQGDLFATTKQGFDGLVRLIEGDKEEVEETVLMAIGYASVYLPEYNKE